MQKVPVLISILLMIFFCGIFCSAIKEEGHNHEDAKAQNLKILPKNMSMDDIHKVMKGFAKSLGVRCNACHVGTEGDPKSFDFAADTKKEKLIARKMMKMVDAINNKYLGKMGESDFEQITCVTCHMGHMKPTVSVDSLMKK